MINKTKIVLLALCSLLVSLCMSELFLRILTKHSYSLRLLTVNPKVGSDIDRIFDWKTLIESTMCPTYPGLTMNGFVFNDRGFETPNSPNFKRTGVKRIVLIGDSFAAGIVPYPYHFIRILETSLNQQLVDVSLHHNVEVINLGLYCLGPALERKVLEVEGIKYQPDYVILAFFVGNDFTDDKYNLEEIHKKNTDSQKPSGWQESLQDIKFISLLRNLHILFKSRNLFQVPYDGRSQTGIYTGSNVEKYDPMKPYMDRDVYLKILSGRLGVYIHNSETYEHLDDVYRNILEMKKLSGSVNAKFLVVIIPDEMQVNPYVLNEVLSNSKFSQITVDIVLPQRLLNNFFAENNIDSIDLLPYFLNDSQPERLYQPLDTHLNTYGNQLVAHILYDHFQPIIKKDFSKDYAGNRNDSILGAIDFFKEKIFVSGTQKSPSR